jgi:hypothetical protein
VRSVVVPCKCLAFVVLLLISKPNRQPLLSQPSGHARVGSYKYWCQKSLSDGEASREDIDEVLSSVEAKLWVYEAPECVVLLNPL